MCCGIPSIGPLSDEVYTVLRPYLKSLVVTLCHIALVEGSQVISLNSGAARAKIPRDHLHTSQVCVQPQR